MIIEVVGAVVRDADGRFLAVRKRGTTLFMLPGGKPEAGEAPAEALLRELREELGVELASAELIGRFEAAAANEPGRRVCSTMFAVTIAGTPQPGAEIAELAWISPEAPHAPLAPLLHEHLLPRLLAGESLSPHVVK